ncbi:hypothetical protein KIPB_016726, partial [Kipferlia bialata]|eukprot:g16726.t1
MASPHGQLFSPESLFMGADGGGAANLWAAGYNKGKAQ